MARRSRLLVVAFLVAGGLPGASAFAAEGNILAEQCLRQVRESRYDADKGTKPCADAISSGDLDDETLALVLYARGAIMMHHGQTRLAAESFAQAALINPEPSFVHFMRGMSRLIAGDPALAVVELNAALARRDNIAVRQQRGRALLQLGRYEAALDDFHHVLDAWPLSAEAFIGRGASLLAQGRPDAAIIEFDRVLALAPDDVDALVYRAAARFDKGDLAQARADAERVAQLRPRSSGAVFLAARLRFADGDWRGANTALLKAIDIATPAERRSILFWQAIAQRRMEGQRSVGGVIEAFDRANAARWPMTAMRFFVRSQYPEPQFYPLYAPITEAQVFASANDPDPKIATVQRVQAAFFVSQTYLALDRPKDAARVLAQVADAGLFDSWEYRVNLLELARLSKAKR